MNHVWVSLIFTVGTFAVGAATEDFGEAGEQRLIAAGWRLEAGGWVLRNGPADKEEEEEPSFETEDPAVADSSLAEAVPEANAPADVTDSEGEKRLKAAGWRQTVDGNWVLGAAPVEAEPSSEANAPAVADSSSVDAVPRPEADAPADVIESEGEKKLEAAGLGAAPVEAQPTSETNAPAVADSSPVDTAPRPEANAPANVTESDGDKMLKAAGWRQTADGGWVLGAAPVQAEPSLESNAPAAADSSPVDAAPHPEANVPANVTDSEGEKRLKAAGLGAAPVEAQPSPEAKAPAVVTASPVEALPTMIDGMPLPSPTVRTHTSSPTVASDSNAELQAEFKAVKFEVDEQDDIVAALHPHQSLWNWLLMLIAIATLVSFARIIKHSLSKNSGALWNSGSPKKIDDESFDVEANMESVSKPLKEEVIKQVVVSRTSTSSITSEVVKESAISHSGWDEWEEQDDDWGEQWGTKAGWTDNPFDDAGSPYSSSPKSGTSPGISNAEAKALDMFGFPPQRGMKGKAD